MKGSSDRVVYMYEPKLLGEEGTINKLISLVPAVVNEYLVVINGDTLTHLDLSLMFRLSNGKSIRHMDKGVYAGVKILSPDYLQGKNKRIINYFSTSWWQDCGTFLGIIKANRYLKQIDKDYKAKHEEKLGSMS